MSYLPRNNKTKNKKLKKALVFLVIFFVLAYGLSALAPSFLPRTAHFFAIPLWKAESFFSNRLGYTKDFILARKSIVEENRKLRQELEREKERLFFLQVLEKENADLKSFLGRATSDEGVLAAVLAKPPKMLFDILIIDAGSDLGVEEGNFAGTEEGVALGQVQEVLKNTSTVRLFSTSGEETSGFIARNNLSVTLIGRGGGDFEIQLPQEIDVIPEDIIVMPSVDTMVLAKVVSVEHLPTDSFQTVLAKSPVNFSELRWVVIWK